jgi:hypothetical protein
MLGFFASGRAFAGANDYSVAFLKSTNAIGEAKPSTLAIPLSLLTHSIE